MAEASVVNRVAEEARQAPPFGDVLCAVDGSRGSEAALGQAISLCAPGAALSFVAVVNEVTSGSLSQVDLTEARASSALDQAVSAARGAGIQASRRLIHGAHTADLLLAEAEAGQHDLLVVGCRGIPRHAGIAVGSTATQLAHRSRLPLLVARRTPAAFPQGILLATDGSPGSWGAAKAAVAVARTFRSPVRLVYVPDGMHPERYREVLKQVKLVEREAEGAPEIIDDPGHVAERIDEAARTTHSPLIVIGKRGRTGLGALGSVSERVLHKAASSVLVVPSGASQEASHGK